MIRKTRTDNNVRWKPPQRAPLGDSYRHFLWDRLLAARARYMGISCHRALVGWIAFLTPQAARAPPLIALAVIVTLVGIPAATRAAGAAAKKTLASS